MTSSRTIGRVVVATVGACGVAALVAACGSNGGSGDASVAKPPSDTPSPRTTTATTTVTPSSSAVPSITSKPTASRTPSSSAAPAASDPCPDGTVRVTAGQLGGATGHGGLVLSFRNESGRTCTLHGYPGLDALSARGSTLAHAKRTLSGFTGGSKQGEPTVKLANHKSASARAEWTNIPQGSSGSCATAAKILVTPPNTKRSTTIDKSVSICSLQIHPVVPGSDGNLS